MESATILMPPSTGLRGILLSVRTPYSRFSCVETYMFFFLLILDCFDAKYTEHSHLWRLWSASIYEE